MAPGERVDDAEAPPPWNDGERPLVHRIVSLAPSNTEIAYYLGLGEQVVGVCDDSDWPADARTKVKVGMDLQIDAGKVAALKPDMVLASLSVPGMEKCVAAVRERGLDAIVLNPKSLEDVFSNIEEIAKAAGVPQRGFALTSRMRKGLGEVADAVKGLHHPTLFWEWWPRPLISPGGRSWMVDVVRTAGATMLFQDEQKESFIVEVGRILNMDPEVIVLCWVGALATKQDPAKVYERELWAGVQAVRNQRVYALPDVLFAAPGPRLLDGARALAKVLHPHARL